MSLRSGSSRRKPQVTHRVNQKSARNDDTNDDDDELSSAAEECEVRVAKRNGKDDDQTSDNVEVLPELPEGTVIVEPEPVDDRPKSLGVRKQKGTAFNSDSVSKSFLARVTCTACGKQINPHIYGAARRHPHVKALICKKCYKFYKSGDITKDQDGLDEQCRWCGEGGKLFGCDYCHNVFCKACIQRNFGRGELSNVDVGDAKWKCYICSPRKMVDLIEHCNKVLDYMEKEREKEKEVAKKEKQQTTKSTVPKAEHESQQHSRSISKSLPDRSDNVGASKLLPKKFCSRGIQVSSTNNVEQQKTVAVKAEVVDNTLIPDRLQIAQPALVEQMSKSSMDDLKQYLLNVNVNNVQDKIEKFITVVKSMSLMMEAIKTDLAIAQLSGQFNNAVRVNAVTSLSTGMEVFFNSYKEILGKPPPRTQVTTELKPKAAISVVNGNRYKNETSTPLVTRYAREVKKELNISAIPIMIDESDEGGESPKKIYKVNRPDTESCGKSQDIVCLHIDDDEDNDAESEKKPAEEKSAMDRSQSPSKQTSNVNSEDIKRQKILDKEIKENNKEEDCSEVNNDDDDDKRKPSAKIKFMFKKVEKKKEMDEDTENLSKLEDKLKIVIDSIDKENEMSDETDTDSNKEWKRSSQRKSSQEKVEKDKDESEKIKGNGDDGENIAAQLELLKEMADELSEKTEKAQMNSQQDDSATETEEINEEGRKSDRKDKKDQEEDEDDSDPEDGKKSGLRKSRRKKYDNSVNDKKNVVEEGISIKSKKGESSKCGKFEKEEDDLSARRKGKSEKKVESQDETVESDNGKSKKRKQTRTENEGKNLSSDRTSSDRSKKEKVDSSNSDDDDDDDDDSSEEEETQRRTRRSRKRGAAAAKKREKKLAAGEKGDKKTSKSDSENYDSELEQEIEKFEKDPVLRRSSRRNQEVENETEKEGKDEQKSKSEHKQKGGKKSKKNEDDDVSLSIGSDSDSNEDEEEEEDNAQNVMDAENEAAKLALLHEAEKEDNEHDEEEDMDEDNKEEFDMPSSDSEVTFSRKTKESKDKESRKTDDDDDDTDDDDDDSSDPPVRKTRLKSKLLDAKLSESDSEDDEEGKKKNGKGKGKERKRKMESSEDDYQDAFDDDDGSDIEGPKRKKKGRKRTRESSDEESDSDASSKKRSYKQKGKKRRRIKLLTNSSDEEAEDEDIDNKKGDKKKESDNEGGDDDEGGHFLKRKKIRKLMSNKKLAEETKQARKAEEERRKRIEERQKQYNNYIEVEGEDKVETEEGKKLIGSPIKCPVTTKLVMQVDEKTKDPIIEMDRTLVRKLKPHQVEAVQFMWNCCVENIDRLKKEEGSGCILAHCMGLGKTLSVISFLHMMMSNQKQTRIKCCLVVCPLNTVLNWQREFEMWQEDLDYQTDVFELSLVKQNFARADYLKDWHENGGVMIMGYDMYRRLTTGHKQKKKGYAKKKQIGEIFQESLVDPGPDILVCDEGHILKNDSSAISKATSQIKTKRRIVLTGTPLQNNLGEYHCMVNFVKTNLLGTRREFANRFINPITNGQCSDSTPYDVKIMKRRAHILHEMLAGCVQRKDYSALTKFLPPKFEYVINVRLSKVQIELYEKYLEMSLRNTDGVVTGRGGRLFTDYQFLMRIWTHPWVLKLDEIRQENRRTYDSEDSFIDDEEDTDEESDMSLIDNSSEVSSVENSDTIDSDEDCQSKAKDKQKKDKGNKDEIVKKWTTRSRRGDEDGAGPSQPLKEEEFQFDKGVSSEWWAEYVKEEDKFKLETGGKLVLLFQILKMCENIGDKVLVFSQSLLSLDIIEDFLEFFDTQAQKEHEENAKNVDDKEKKEEKEGGKVKDDELKEFGKNWSKGVDYFRLDGSTNPQNRKKYADSFNDLENYRARLFLISTKAGSLGINLVAANRVIIFDASWNPSHDVQSMFRVYRFGQEKPVYIYRFLAQGTMEEKIYERQVTKQSLSLRVIDENQIERHFSASDLQELYTFTPDRLDDLNRKEKPTPKLPKDVLLAELLQSHKDWIVGYHDHDSLLENIQEEELTEEERKAAWEEYEEDKKGIRVQSLMVQPGFGTPPMTGAYNQGFSGWHPGMFPPQGMPNIGPNGLLQIVNDLKLRFPGMPPELFQQRVQAVLRQLLAQQIMQQQEVQRRQVEQRQLQELQRLNQIKQQIQRQRQQIAVQQSQMGLSSLSPLSMYDTAQPFPTLNTNMPTSSTLSNMLLGQNVHRSQPKS